MTDRWKALPEWAAICDLHWSWLECYSTDPKGDDEKLHVLLDALCEAVAREGVAGCQDAAEAFKAIHEVIDQDYDNPLGPAIADILDSMKVRDVFLTAKGQRPARRRVKEQAP